ncbi:MAG: hypothetical protein Kow0099_30050 [Candidatus Abyssubacteria bacterium]
MGQRGRWENDFADGLALAAAALWTGGAMLFAVIADVPLLTVLKRALIGAIAAYAAVFAGMHVMMWCAYTTALKKARARELAEPEPEPPTDRPGPATQ